MTSFDKRLVVREHGKERPDGRNITQDDFKDVEALLSSIEEKCSAVLTIKNGYIQAKNFVGIVETQNKTIIEILPKIKLGINEDDTRRIFLEMLRTWRGWRKNRITQLSQSNIRALHRFNMQEIFFRCFLNDLVLLIKRGLARNYFTVEENGPILKGRILFPQHIKTNIIDRSRFYVEYDEFSTNRPANRLIHLTIDELIFRAREQKNLQLLNQLKINFIEVPKSVNVQDDWAKHKIDRSMKHYDEVMQWIGIFLFGSGLATFSGKHFNQSLLFPMEQIFEDYVTSNFLKYRSHYEVKKQGPKNYLAQIGSEDVFEMKPDISLMESGKNTPKFILDTKWKSINEGENKGKKKHGIDQGDMYQLFAYGKVYGCNNLALIYPKTDDFDTEYHYVFDDKMKLICFPFDVTRSKESVKTILEKLENI